jgi:hypothetical protein
MNNHWMNFEIFHLFLLRNKIRLFEIIDLMHNDVDKIE